MVLAPTDRLDRRTIPDPLVRTRNVRYRQWVRWLYYRRDLPVTHTHHVKVPPGWVRFSKRHYRRKS